MLTATRFSASSVRRIVFGGFRVDRNGVQIAHKLRLVQWQDGKKVIVWPEELAPI